MSGFRRFRQAAGPRKGLRQLYKTSSYPLAVAQLDAYFERFTAVGDFGVLLSQTSLGSRKAFQQVGFFRRINGVL